MVESGRVAVWAGPEDTDQVEDLTVSFQTEQSAKDDMNKKSENNCCLTEKLLYCTVFTYFLNGMLL